MTRLGRSTALVVVMMAVSVGFVFGGQGGRGRQDCQRVLLEAFNKLPEQLLSSVEREDILHLCEEEKLARDVYRTLYKKWRVSVFSNISAAEQRHMDLVRLLIERYDLPDPVVDNRIGAFTDPGLDRLYDELVARGRTSLVEALNVGATIEDLDLADLKEMLVHSDNDDVSLIAQNLAKGSRNHLRAFVRTLKARGETYSAQYLSQAEVDEIVASPTERAVIYDQDGNVLAKCGGPGGGF